MTAIAVEKNTSEKREKRAKSIAAMGLVNREGDKFRVSTPSLRGRQTSYEVWRNETGRIRCNCLEFEEAAVLLVLVQELKIAFLEFLIPILP